MKICPQCGIEERDLPRHMRLIHNWSDVSSRSVTGLFGLRKQKSITEVDGKCAKKYQHYVKICPFPNCYATTKNPGEQLRSNMHNLK